MQEVQETGFQSLGQKDPLRTHPSILARKIPWTEQPGSLQSMGSHKRVTLDRVTEQEASQKIVQERGGWRAAVHGVTELDTTEQLNNRTT